MPELPEVETYRRYIEAAALDQPITHFTCEDPRTLMVSDYETMQQALVGAAFVRTHRVGKNLFVQTTKDDWVYMHFGMSGDLLYYHQDEPPPRHARMNFFFQNGYRLAFICPRKFERVGLVSDPEAFLREKGVSEDALAMSLATFTAGVRRRKAPVKSVFLDQSIVAGIGNWLADDILYQARVHPETPAHTLTDAQVLALYDAMHYVVRTTIEAEAHYEHLPVDFVLHARGWGQPQLAGRCPCGEEAVTVMRIGGRSTYYCRTRQLLS